MSIALPDAAMAGVAWPPAPRSAVAVAVSVVSSASPRLPGAAPEVVLLPPERTAPLPDDAPQLRPPPAGAPLRYGAAHLTAALGRMLDLIATGNLEGFEGQRNVLQELQERHRAQMQRRAQEMEAQARKAEALGGLLQGLGWVATVLGFVGAVFTGGATLALAAAGLALAAIDGIVQATTGVSPLGELMKPLMEGLTGLMNRIKDWLESVGVDADAALGVAIAAVVALTAAVVVAGYAAAKRIVPVLAEQIARQVAGGLGRLSASSVGRMLHQVLREMLRRYGLRATAARAAAGVDRLRRGVADGLGNDVGRQLLLNRVERGTQTLLAANQAVQAGGGIASAAHARDALHSRAGLTLSAADLQRVGDVLRQLLDAFANGNRTVDALRRQMSEIVRTDADMQRFVLHNLRPV